MAASPEWKVYDSKGHYQAACKEVEAAAALVSLYGEGSQIRLGHTLILWEEGKDGHAGESYDAVVITVYRRRDEFIEHRDEESKRRFDEIYHPRW